jgi:hypothetical protein
MKRLILALSAVAVIAGVSACSSSTQQSMTQSQAYRYGMVIGDMTWLTANAQNGKLAADAMCQEEAGRITSTFVPDADLVEFPQWKSSQAKGHPGWFFLGIKAGCKH